MTGDTGFLDYAIAEHGVDEAARVVVLGVSEAHGRASRDAASAPAALRRASTLLGDGLRPPGVDLGDAAPGSDWAATMAKVALDAASTGATAVFLGGGRAVAAQAFAVWRDAPVIAATHRLTEALVGRDTLWLGLNGPQPAALWDRTVGHGQRHLSARAIDAGGRPDWPERAVLWLDAAVFDIGYAAGADESNPGGVAPDSLVALMARWSGRPSGVVVSGAAPERDPRGLTELALMRIVQQALRHG